MSDYDGVDTITTLLSPSGDCARAHAHSASTCGFVVTNLVTVSRPNQRSPFRMSAAARARLAQSHARQRLAPPPPPPAPPPPPTKEDDDLALDATETNQTVKTSNGAKVGAKVGAPKEMSLQQEEEMLAPQKAKKAESKQEAKASEYTCTLRKSCRNPSVQPPCNPFPSKPTSSLLTGSGVNGVPGILATKDASGQQLLPYTHQRQAVTKCVKFILPSLLSLGQPRLRVSAGCSNRQLT